MYNYDYDAYNYISCLGIVDCAVTINPELWAHCMLEESCAPPTAIPPIFAELALFFLQSIFGLKHVDITHKNCMSVYLSLVSFLCNILNSLKLKIY